MTDTMLGISREAFMEECWRKSFHVFRHALDPRPYRISREDLAPLVASDLVESRMVSPDYVQTFGPFEDQGEGDFIPDGHMLMVQCVEQFVPRISQMLDEHFDFMPRWQIDDVMVSMGNDRASCGAHFDRYDVFLVQIEGSKRWRLDRRYHQESELVEDADIALLAEFVPEEEITLNPGDVLYVPPGAGHHGICEGLSVTLSVGVRNPGSNELLAELMNTGLDSMRESLTIEDNLYRDVTISDQSIRNIRSMLEQTLTDETIIRWYGCYVTRLLEPGVLDSQAAEPPKSNAPVRLTLPTRAALFEMEDKLLLFVNGEHYELDRTHRDWVADLVRHRQVILPVTTDASCDDCIDELYRSGALTGC